MSGNCGCSGEQLNPETQKQNQCPKKPKHNYFDGYSEYEKQLVAENLGFATGNVIVNNYPDEEDITKVKQNRTEVLKLKDKSYDPQSYSGLGRVYLRKNIKQVGIQCPKYVNILTQEMFQDYDGNMLDNTIFIIQYDYDLNGQFIELPENSILFFFGGSLFNGTLVLHNTSVMPSFLDTFNLKVNLVGNFKVGTTLFDNGLLKYWDGLHWRELGKTNNIVDSRKKYSIYFGASEESDKQTKDNLSKIKINLEDSPLFRIDSAEVAKYHYIFIPNDLTTANMSIYIDGQRSTALNLFKGVSINNELYSVFRTSTSQKGEHDYQIKFYID